MDYVDDLAPPIAVTSMKMAKIQVFRIHHATILKTLVTLPLLVGISPHSHSSLRISSRGPVYLHSFLVVLTSFLFLCFVHCNYTNDISFAFLLHLDYILSHVHDNLDELSNPFTIHPQSVNGLNYSDVAANLQNGPRY